MVPAYIVGGGFVGFAVIMTAICWRLASKEMEARRLRQAQTGHCQQA